MLFLRNIQAQKPDFLFFCCKTEEDISQIYFDLHEYFFVRRVGAVFAGSSGQTCLG
ncbi:predicted protein [Escherichia coli FVEC1412]|nr:predicted protein [Escherichia coli FVEC1412]EFI22589.1 predicted protein [Escherichia coli FVEC1302]